MSCITLDSKSVATAMLNAVIHAVEMIIISHQRKHAVLVLTPEMKPL
jgi:hypothetical protein